MHDRCATSDATSPVTVVIATRDRAGLLEKCLEALSLALREGDRVVVVDSASSSGEVRGIAERAGALVVRCEQPGGCRARNLGWQAADTEIVAFTDDDCLPAPGWISGLSTVFVRFPSVAFVTGRVLADDAIRGHAELDLSLSAGERPLSIGVGADLRQIGHGANMAWRRSILDAMGGFDEDMGPGAPLRAAEDQDAFWRALRRGEVGRYEPQSVVVHRHWRNRRDQLRTVYGYGVGSGALEVKRWRLEAGVAAVPRELSVHALLTDVDRRAGRRFVHGVTENVRRGYEMGIVGEVCFFAGFLAGSIKARQVAITNDRFGSALSGRADRVIE